MRKEKGECSCSERQTGARTSGRRPMEISPEALELLRRATVPFEFKEVVREVVPDMGITPPSKMEETPTFPGIDITSIEAPTPWVSVPLVERPAATVPVSWPEMSTSGMGGNAFYLTDLTLDLSGVAHMTPGLLALSFSTLSRIVNNNLACCQEGEEELVLAQAQFSSDPIVTGFTVPEDRSTIESKEETLTIKPERLARWVRFRIGVALTPPYEIRATHRIINVDPDAGTVTFRVKGKSATPASEPTGDTFIEAFVGAYMVARARVVVVIPKAIATPHPTFNGQVNGVNMALSASSKPPIDPAGLGLAKLQPGHVAIVTAYFRTLTITVNDQFGDKLDAIYAGAPVTEGGNPINQQMTAAGTYDDPVGAQSLALNAQVPEDEQRYWLQVARVLSPETDQTTNIPVEVGGHSLDPAIVNRRVQFTHLPGPPVPRGNLTITWPD